MKEWSYEDMNTLAAMKKEGKEYGYIATLMSRTPEAVGKKFRQMVDKHQHILKKHGIKVETALRKTTHTRHIENKIGENIIQKAAEKIATKRSSRKGIIYSNGGLKRWSEEERKSIIRLKNEGTDFGDIAATFNRTKKSIKSMYEYLERTRPDLFAEYGTKSVEAISNPAKTKSEGTRSSENKAFLVELEKYTGEEFRPHDPEHIAVAFSLAGMNHGRDIQKIARVMNVPEKWVAFVFNSLDYSGIWPKDEESYPVRTTETYSQMNRSLRRDVPYLHDMRRRGAA